MARHVKRLAIIGQGLIGSSITRAAHLNGSAQEIVVTDASEKVRARVKDLGIGQASVVETMEEAVRDADLAIICVPVGQIAAVARACLPRMKGGAVLSDVGSVKRNLVEKILPFVPGHVSFVPAHPLAGTEFSGPDAGQSRLFEKRWCILTPAGEADPKAVAMVVRFWESLGSAVSVMSPLQHDYALSLTSHLPHLAAFSIFHTALKYEKDLNSEVIKYSAGGFRDFTRIAASSPEMWRDIFIDNKNQILAVLGDFIADLKRMAVAIENEDGPAIVDMLSVSRLTRRKVIEKEHISAAKKKTGVVSPIKRPYSND